MKIRNLPTVLALHTILFATSLAVLYKAPTQVLSVTNHVVISEIQVGGGVSTDEFVELYNPTNDAVDLTNWRLSKKTATGTESDIIAASMSGALAPHGYFLIAHANYDGAVGADTTYSGPTTIASDNAVLLYDDSNELVDKVGMGTANDPETTATTSPANNRSIERRAQASSTADSMAGGADATNGNSYDTDNNLNDFVYRTTVQGTDPQNTSSATETLVEASPSPTPEATPSPTPEASPSPTPEVSPTPEASPTPTVEPSSTPEASPSPTPETSPSPTPETTPSPTPAASPSPTPETSPSPDISPTPTPTPSPSPSPSPGKPPFFSGFLFTCSVRHVPIRFGRFTFNLPFFRCTFK